MTRMRPALRTVLAVTLLTGALVAPLDAELRYTMKIESQKSTEPLTTPPSPLMAMLGGMVAGTMAPAGGLEITVTMGERGSRVEYDKAYTIVPAGGVTLVRPDGSMLVIDPAAKTFWKIAKPDLSAIKPEVTVTRTGQRAMMAGVDSERVTIAITVPLPVPPGTQLPPGIPPRFQVNGEAWIADKYKDYARMSAGLSGMMALGLEKLAGEGLPMKSVIRGEMFGDQQIESTITSIAEVAVPAGTFDVPADYKEVAAPTTMPGMPQMPR